MIFAFMYSADVAHNEGGCNELMGCYEDKDIALAAALDLATVCRSNEHILYLDLLQTDNQGRPYVEHYRRRSDERHFHFTFQYPVSHNTDRHTDDADASPY